MSIEVLPLGYKCNIGCTYCYQEPLRDAENTGDAEYDMTAMKAALLKEGYRFSIFGGEPLLVRIEDLAELWRFGYEEFGEAAKANGEMPNGIQTNGTLMTPAHVRLIKRYGVGVGFSIDGPGELNDARWAGTEEATREATGKSIASLELLLREGLGPSLIVTLHSHNASTERLPRLLDWFRELAELGLRNVNLHLLEIDTDAAVEMALSDQENAEAMIACARLQSEITISFEPINDMVRLLRGEDKWNQREDGNYGSGTSCVWNSCDPYTTDAVRGVDGQGNRQNCGRTYKDGVPHIKANTRGYERYLALYHTPQEFGGCAGCRFFYACKGQCPGTGEGHDWRGKTEHCEVLKLTFAALEGMLVAKGQPPFSLSDERPLVEAAMLASWQLGVHPSVTKIRSGAVAQVAAERQRLAGQIDHVDIPHGDEHEDHTDTARGAAEGAAWAQL